MNQRKAYEIELAETRLANAIQARNDYEFNIKMGRKDPWYAQNVANMRAQLSLEKGRQYRNGKDW